MFKDYCEFDIAAGLYHYLQHNWYGMDDKYEAFCMLTQPRMYKPSSSEEYFENISEESREVYNSLNDSNYREALDKVLNYQTIE